jgi:hypothetical protein
MDDQRRQGFVPGGKDRVQWIFEGEDWPEVQVQSIIDRLTPFIQTYREHFWFDMVNYSWFSYADAILPSRIYYMTRRSWRYHDHAFSFDDLLQCMQKAMDMSKAASYGMPESEEERRWY